VNEVGGELVVAAGCRIGQDVLKPDAADVGLGAVVEAGRGPAERLVVDHVALGAFDLQFQRCAVGVVGADEGGGVGDGVDEDGATVDSLARFVDGL
jgi:hypothetical protein